MRVTNNRRPEGTPQPTSNTEVQTWGTWGMGASPTLWGGRRRTDAPPSLVQEDGGRLNTMQCKKMLYDEYNAIQNNAAWRDATHYRTMHYNTMQRRREHHNNITTH